MREDKTDDVSEIIMEKLVSLKDTNWSKLDTDKLDQLRKQQQDFKREIDEILQQLELKSISMDEGAEDYPPEVPKMKDNLKYRRW